MLNKIIAKVAEFTIQLENHMQKEKTQSPIDQENEIKMFSRADILQATNSLNAGQFIGNWRFGTVYKGSLHGSPVFFKVLNYQSFPQDEHEFLRELNVLKQIRHPNLVNLVGASVEARTLVYELHPITEYSLESLLLRRPELFPWSVRVRIVSHLCSVLAFLYSLQPPVFHGHSKAPYAFLTANLDVKLFVPGFMPSENPSPKGIFTEYIETGNRILSSDVYSLGSLILGLLTGLPDSTIQGEVHDARKEEWVRKNVDKKAGSWPFQLAEKLACFGSKFCVDNARPLREIVEDLRTLSAEIDGFESASADTITNKEENEMKMLSRLDIVQATNGFNLGQCIGNWRFGAYYRGFLHGSPVFFKVLNYQSYPQDEHEFLRELKVLKEIRHPNLLNLVGASIEARTLIYELHPITEYSLESLLRSKPQLFPWNIRVRLVSQLCSVLGFLYSLEPPVFHGHSKASFTFLTANMDVKVFIPGFAPSDNPSPKGIFTECIETGNRRLSSDVYSLGILILGLLTGLPDSTIQGEVHDARKEEWVRENVDKKAGDWPLHLAEKLAGFGSKFCLDNTRPLREIVEDLRTLSAAIDNLMKKGKGVDGFDSASTDTVTIKEAPAYSDSEVDDNKKTSEIRGTTPQAVASNVSNETSRSKMFSESEIHSATNGLSETSRIGKGGYGSVYKGYLDNIEVAIKMLDPHSTQGLEEFIQELDVLGEIHHPNLVRLVGTCFKLRSLVYEFLPNGSLEDCLKKRPEVLTWQMRVRIVFEICSGLIFLHSQRQPMVHGDLKPANILLDANFTAKLADFGLCRLLPEGSTSATVAYHITKNIKGTEWYIDPDFLESGKITPGCDVYAFGITILRLLTKLPAANILRKVRKEYKREKTMAIVDRTAGDWPNEVAEYLAFIGLECCEEDRKCSRLMREMSMNLDDMLANKCA